MEIIAIITEAGTIGLAAALIWLIVKLSKMSKEIIGNHINHNTEILIEVRDAVRELTRYLRNGKK